jgi:hypothetical protein
MKRIVLIAGLALSAPLAHADEPVSCADVGKLAQTVMDSRQAGVTMSDMMDVVDGIKALQNLVRMAYDKPRMSTEEMMTRSAQDFRNEVEAVCYRAQANDE